MGLRWALAMGTVAFSLTASASAAPARLLVLPFAAPPAGAQHAGALTRLVEDELEGRRAPLALVPAGVHPLEALEAAALERMAHGKRQLDELRPEAALRTFDRAVRMLLQDGVPAGPDALHEVALSLAVAALRRGDEDRARGALEELLRLAPELRIDPALYPPLFVRELARAQKNARAIPRGDLIVEGPAEASVFVDGVALGAPPAVAHGLVAGAHTVRVEGRRGERFVERVMVKPGAPTRVAALLVEPAPSLPPPVRVDQDELDRLAAFADARGVELVLLGAVEPFARDWAVGLALFSARRRAVTPLGVQLLRDGWLADAAARIGDDVVDRLERFGAPARLPLTLLDEPREAPATSRLRAPAPPAAAAPPAAVAGAPARPSAGPALTRGSPWWVWALGGVGVAAVIGGTYLGVRHATRPVTGTVTATW